MKPLAIVLALLFVFLQYKLWFEHGSVSEVVHLHKAIATQDAANNKLAEDNTALVAEVQNLKVGQDAVEARARNDLGMTKPGEVFYQIIDK